MLASRRLLLLCASLAIVPMPACLHISGSVTPTETVEPKHPTTGEFASFPKRPGDVVRTNPGANTLASKPAPEVEPVAATPPATDPEVVAASDPAAPSIAIPAATDPTLVAALRAYIENRPDDAIKLLQSLERSSQDYALALLPVLVRGTQLNMANAKPEDVAMLVEQLHGIAARLEPKAALKVEKVVFCRPNSVMGFGRFEPWPEVQPYKPNDMAMLYVEVRNLASEPTPGPKGETFLSRATLTLEVRDATGKLVEQSDPSNYQRRVSAARIEYAEHTRSPLTDYYRTYRILVPNQPGVYNLTVEVKDGAGKRVARSQPTEFRVAGP